MGQHSTGRALEAARTEERKGYGHMGHPSSAKAEDGGARVPVCPSYRGRAEKQQIITSNQNNIQIKYYESLLLDTWRSRGKTQ